MAHDYGREKFWQAIDVLATSDGNIQERLANAAIILGRLHQPGNDLPKNLHKEFNALMHELTREPAKGDEGTIVATTQKLSADEAKRLAGRILSLYTAPWRVRYILRSDGSRCDATCPGTCVSEECFRTFGGAPQCRDRASLRSQQPVHLHFRRRASGPVPGHRKHNSLTRERTVVKHIGPQR